MTDRKDVGVFKDYGLSDEEIRFAVRGHYYEYPGMDGERGEIWCYTDRITYASGECVNFHISATAKTCTLKIRHDVGDRKPSAEFRVDGLGWQDTPEDCSVTGCGWKASFAFTIPDDWPSGLYRIDLEAEGRDGHPLKAEHMFCVTPNASVNERKGRVLHILATGTWTAYNTWGGSNHYQGITGPEKNLYSPVVSLLRPWARGFVSLPEHAPRVPLEVTLPPGTPPRYPHMEWAYANGFSKKYASAGWASYDRHFQDWALSCGYGIDTATQHDLQFNPEILDGYDCIVMVGHDEYWTWQMRDAVDRYLEQGGHAARFAGNFMWQTRLEDGGATQVCYKYRARAEDPVYGSGDERFATTSWEAPEVGRPGAETFGLNATRGLYVGWGGCAPRGQRGFPVYRPSHWAFKDTGLRYGDILGSDGHVFGYEVDGLDHIVRNGLPEALPKEGAPDSVEILAMGISSLMEEGEDIRNEDVFFGDEDAIFVAETLIGNASPEALEEVKRGCGMIVNFPKGKGEVFHAGSCEWVAGLLRKDGMVEAVTRNVLDRYIGAG